MDRYPKIFFWIFVILGALWGWQERAMIEYYLSYANLSETVGDLLSWLFESGGPADIPQSFGDLVGLLVLAVFIIIIGIAVIVVGAAAVVLLAPLLTVGAILYVTHLHSVLVGAIFAYPFYVLYLNLFELFLLLLIRHPVAGDIRYLAYGHELNFGKLATIAAKLMIPIQSNPPALASTILDRQVQKAKKLLSVELGIMRRLRHAKIQEAVEAMERQEESGS